jgi:hypothetical protein
MPNGIIQHCQLARTRIGDTTVLHSLRQRYRLYDHPMPERRLLSVGVECYAGHRGEQIPRTLILGDRHIDVAAVVDAWLAPDYWYFKLRGADGNTYLVPR